MKHITVKGHCMIGLEQEKRNEQIPKNESFITYASRFTPL